MPNAKSRRVWKVAEAKIRLSEILRLSETEGPQHIGARKAFVVVPAQLWAERETPRGTGLEIPFMAQLQHSCH